MLAARNYKCKPEILLDYLGELKISDTIQQKARERHAMNRILEIIHDGEMIHLLEPKDLHTSANTFTVVVGENGVGKSRLLSEIARKCMRETPPYWDGLPRVHRDPVVIAASTSPFDKFPAPPRRNSKITKNYRYVGMRGEGLFGASSAVSLLSSAARGLLSQLAQNRPSVNLLGVLESLSFRPVFEFILKPQFIRSEENEVGKRSAHRDGMVRQMAGRHHFMIDAKAFAIAHAAGESSGVLDDLAHTTDVIESHGAIRLTVDFSDNAAFLDGKALESGDLFALLRLFDSDMIRMMDIRVQKNGHETFSLKRASSGEQCLLVLMLGIAGHIQDGSLILVDEPEISLHPEWQERFMEMLQSTFSHYRHCQFIIATHSPQVISRLAGPASYIYHLRKKQLYRAAQFERRSADYQLAELFDAPGLMNEYISRVCFNLIAQVRANAGFTQVMHDEIAWLKKTRNKLDSKDKLRILVESVLQLVKADIND